MMRKKALVLMIIMSAFCLSGCKRIELDQDTEDAYVEYAVNAVINHDKNNMLKMERVNVEVKEEPEWIPDEEATTGDTPSTDGSGDAGNAGGIAGGEIADSQMTYSSFEQALGNDALSFTVSGVKECGVYPDSNPEELGFVITASAGSRLVVLELDVTNISGSDVTLDTTEGYTFKGMFNGVVKTNALVTSLEYELNNNSHTISSGETKRVVLVYELNKERIPEITKAVIAVSKDDVTYNVSVK